MFHVEGFLGLTLCINTAICTVPESPHLLLSKHITFASLSCSDLTPHAFWFLSSHIVTGLPLSLLPSTSDLCFKSTALRSYASHVRTKIQLSHLIKNEAVFIQTKNFQYFLCVNQIALFKNTLTWVPELTQFAVFWSKVKHQNISESMTGFNQHTFWEWISS